MFLERVRNPGLCLRLCCWLAPARKWTTGVGDKDREPAPQAWDEGHSSCPPKVLGPDFLEVRSNRLDRADEIPNSTSLPASCLGSNLKPGKRFKPGARTAETLQGRGRRAVTFKVGPVFQSSL